MIIHFWYIKDNLFFSRNHEEYYTGNTTYNFPGFKLSVMQEVIMKIIITSSVNQNKKLISNYISVLISGINNIFQSSDNASNLVETHKQGSQ